MKGEVTREHLEMIIAMAEDRSKTPPWMRATTVEADLFELWAAVGTLAMAVIESERASIAAKEG